MKPFITGLVCGILGTGIVWLACSFRPAADEHNAPSSLASRRAPQLPKSTNSLPVKNAAGPLSLAEQTDIDPLLRKYANLTSDQIREELEKMEEYGNSFPKNYDVKFYLALSYLSYKWGKVAPREAIAYARLRGGRGLYDLSAIVQSWAETDPESATAYFMENKSNLALGKQILNGIAESLVKNSPLSAMKWAGELEPEDRKRILPTLISGIARYNPGSLGEYVGKLHAADLSDFQLCSTIAAKWSVLDWNATKSWIDSLPEEQRDGTFDAALTCLCRTDKNKATEEFKEQSPSRQFSMMPMLINELSMESPLQGLEWITRNVPEEYAPTMTRFALSGELHIFYPELKEYALKQKEGSYRDSILDNLVDNILRSDWASYVDYADTIDLAEKITNGETRTKQRKKVMDTWIRAEPEKAQAWITKAPLDAKQKQDYLRQCEDALKKTHS